MKTILLFLMISLFHCHASSQFFADPQSITDSIYGGFSLYVSDIDGDGDMDLLSASFIDNKIAWYENTDGQGSFGTQQVITTDMDKAYSVFASDLDGDGDADVLSASRDNHTIAWYENTDGQGNFGPQQIITTDATFTRQVYAADLDGDGDNDVLSASIPFAWYENDGNGSFLTHIILTADITDIAAIAVEDIDQDGDLDVLSGAFNEDIIQWYENIDGQGNFDSPQTIDSNAFNVNDIETADMDGDGDMDIVYSTWGGNGVNWIENLDGFGNFGPTILLVSPSSQESINASDVDGDGDLDILAASSFTSGITWYENTDGQGSFGPTQYVTTAPEGAGSIYSTDIDGDSDFDLVSLGWIGMSWYENLTIVLAINENNSVDFNVFPIPTQGIISIESKVKINRIEIYNNVGQLVLSFYNKKHIDISEFDQGQYLLKIIDKDDNYGIKKIVKN
jgi:hypothetical protein